MEKIEKLLGVFTERMREIWREDLVSVILYGSYLRENFDPKISDVNCVVLVRNVAVKKMFLSGKPVRKFHRLIRLSPFFFSVDFFTSSLDSFSLEWKEIKAGYRILYGQDPIKELDIRKEHLRLQLEREVKEKIIRFQQGLLFSRDLPALLSGSAKSFQILYRNGQDLISEEKLSRIDTGHLKEIEELAKKRLKFKRKDLEVLAGKHLAGLTKFAEMIES